MKPRFPHLLAALALACGGTRTSSESHWVQCRADEECRALDAVAACRAGYCEGPDGARYEADGISAPEPVANAGGAGASTASNAGETGSASGARSDGGAPAVGGTASADDGGAQSGGGAAPGGGGASPTEECPEPELEMSPRRHEGNYVVTDATTLSAAEGLTEITGGLSVSSRAVDLVSEITMPHVESIGGDLSLDSSSIVRLALPSLRRIGGNVSIRFNAGLEEVDLRRLQAVDGTLSVTDNPALARLRLDSLESALSVEVRGEALAGCEVESLFDRLSAATGPVGNPDCDCSEACGWLETSCR